MPLDAIGLIEYPSPLTEALARRAIRPVERATLDAHKQRQLANFRPSFWHRNRVWLVLGLAMSILSLGVAAGLVDQGAGGSPWLPLYLMIGWMLVVTTSIASGAFRLAA